MRAGGARGPKAPGRRTAGAARPPARRAIFASNPRVLATAPPALVTAAREALAGALAEDGAIETRPDAANAARIAERVAAARADLLVVAGGDGTVGAAAEALMRLEPESRPPLAILPFGTANNVARSLGLRSVHAGDAAALGQAVEAALGGRERPFDLGRVGERFFAGSFALGMDADILWLRNAVRAWTGDVPLLTGYPLYLASCAANGLRPHGGFAHLAVGRSRAVPQRVYGALVLNVSVYAGEFRFAAGDPSRDGTLDLHTFGGVVEYVGGYTDAWRRQLACGRGEAILDPRTRRKTRRVSFRFDRAVPAQIDGEELAPAEVWRVEAVSAPLAVRVPRRRNA